MFKVGQKIKRIENSHYGVEVDDIVYVVRLDNSDGVVISRTSRGAPISDTTNGKPVIFTIYKFIPVGSNKDTRLLLC